MEVGQLIIHEEAEGVFAHILDHVGRVPPVAEAGAARGVHQVPVAGRLYFFNVTEHPAGKNVEITGKNRADLRLHQGVGVTEGRHRICAVNVTDGQGF